MLNGDEFAGLLDKEGGGRSQSKETVQTFPESCWTTLPVRQMIRAGGNALGFHFVENSLRELPGLWLPYLFGQ